MKNKEQYIKEIYEKHKQVLENKEKDSFYNVNFKSNEIKPLKMVATFILITGITVGIVYATNVKNMQEENIWKNSEIYTYNPNREVSQEEREKCISQEKAKELGNLYLKNIDIQDEVLTEPTLVKGFFSDENEWNMGSKKATISIDANTGNLKSMQIPTWNYRIPYNYGITKEEAEVTARELFEKWKPQDIEGEYKLVELNRNMETDEGSYIWYARFQRKYGELINQYEEVYIGWVPTINGLYTLNIKRDKYENNEQQIDEQKAIEIVKTKEKQIKPDEEIKVIKAEIRIEQMNIEAYNREKNKGQKEQEASNRFEETQDIANKRVRKAWVVVLEYNEKEKFSYYIDSTTGEIIGGYMWDYFESEKIKEGNGILEKN